MTPEQFVYWLQGKIEGRDLVNNPLDVSEQQSIREHLHTLFDKKTPVREIYKTSYPFVVDNPPHDPFNQQPFVC